MTAPNPEVVEVLTALDQRCARAQDSIRGLWNRRGRNDTATKAAEIKGLGLARAFIQAAIEGGEQL